jgi:2-polyprenyl-3-methyl-5-hydroxy-6-metoxy-1,4-benzoquinol methylase
MTTSKATSKKTSWASIIAAASTNPLGLFALIVLTVEAILGVVAASMGGDKSGIVIAMVVLFGIVILSVTIIAVVNPDALRGTASNTKSSSKTPALPEAEKTRLIQANEELVIDAEKPPLSSDDLTRQLQQLRLVLHQAPRYSTPTYYLDRHLSLIHWNVAFELIFKPVLARIRGRHVNYLIAELANHDAVFDHARDFTEKVKQGQLPLVDVEPLVFDSAAYGTVEFEKVATQLTDPDANLRAWAVALFLKNIDWDMYGPDLLQRLRDDKLWGIYAVSYDLVLSEFTLYKKLIEEVIQGIPAGARRVLEIGAGTGNVTRALLQRGYNVTSVENNPLMLEKMSSKRLDQTGRLRIIMNSVENIDLAEEGHFDAVVGVNVVYALEDPSGCFRKVAEALKPRGVFAFSTTHSETNLEPLLAAVESELKANGTFRAREEHYRRVVAINKDIEYTIARSYSREQYATWLEQAGFEIAYNKSSYKDAVIVIHARRV